MIKFKIEMAVEEYGIVKICSSKIKKLGDFEIPVEEGEGVRVQCKRERLWDGEKESIEDRLLRELKAVRILKSLL